MPELAQIQGQWVMPQGHSWPEKASEGASWTLAWGKGPFSFCVFVSRYGPVSAHPDNLVLL